MYLTSDHQKIDQDIRDGFAAVLADTNATADTVERLWDVVKPHLSELRAVRDRQHASHGRVVRGALATHDEVDRLKARIRELTGEADEPDA